MRLRVMVRVRVTVKVEVRLRLRVMGLGLMSAVGYTVGRQVHGGAKLTDICDPVEGPPEKKGHATLR